MQKGKPRMQSHVETLAIPKSLPSGFLEDRRSIYCENNIPRKDYTKTTSFVLTPGQEKLVYSKRLHSEYVGDRPSPMWTVSSAAQTASPSARVASLSQPKQLHPNYQPSREVMTVVPDTALHLRPSRYLHNLARHKTYPPLQIKPNSDWDWGEWEPEITNAAKTAVASARIMNLADPKKAHVYYRPCREVQWSVTTSAQSHVASESLQRLARPKHRSEELEDYDPRAWSVSRGALMTQASPRISELATPLPRKCRPKK